MMNIMEIKAKKVAGCPGSFAWIAEALIETGDGERKYATVQFYDGEEYTIQSGSVYDFLADDGDEPVAEFLEEYDDWEDAQESEYAEVYAVLRDAIDKLG